TTLTETKKIPTVHEGHKYFHLTDLQWYEFSQEYFLKERVEKTHSPIIRHKDSSFNTFFTSYKFEKSTTTVRTEPILMTEEVYDGFRAANPKNDMITQSWGWK